MIGSPIKAFGATALLAIVLVCGCGESDPAPGQQPAFLAPGPQLESGPASAAQPNVVVVMTDDQDVPSMRHMPIVKRLLVDKGTTFTNSFASLPLCCPSRATFLTGQYAHNHGVVENQPPRGGFASFDGTHALPLWMQRAGYRTGWIGKYLNGYGNSRRGNQPKEVPPGWDEWTAPVDHTEYQMFDYKLNINGNLRTYGNAASDYQTDVFARQAEDFIRAGSNERQRFFLTVAPLAPHTEGVIAEDRFTANPRPAPRHRGRFSGLRLPRSPAFNESSVKDKLPAVRQPRLSRTDVVELDQLNRSRTASLLAVDEMVGRLVRALRETDQLEQTVFIFTSDQGFLLGEHRLKGKNRLYDEALRVPLVITGPGFPSGTKARQITANIDLAPTIAQVSGAQPQLPVDGIPLAPLAEDSTKRPDRQIAIELLAGRRANGVIERRYAYFRYRDGSAELYDLRNDPLQLTNIAGQPQAAEVEAGLARQTKRLRRCAGPNCR